MLTALLLMIGGATVIVFVVLGVVVIGIKQEPTAGGLTGQPPSAVTAWIRHLLGCTSVSRASLQPTMKITENYLGTARSARRSPRHERPLAAAPPGRTPRADGTARAIDMAAAKRSTIPGRKEVTAFAGLHG